MVWFGVTEEQLKDVTATALAGGVEQVWRTTQAWISKQQDEIAAEFEKERRDREAATDDQRAGDPRLWAAARDSWEERRERELRKLENARAVPQPVWQEISGLHQPEYQMTPGERAGRIRKLLRAVERVARTELRTEEQRCGGDWRALRNLHDEDGDADGRSHAWDPLRSICYYFGIAKTKLGAYAWEVWGLSAPQIVDRVKCEAVRGALRSEVRAFVEGFYKEHPEAEAEEVWAALRAARKGVGHRTALAARMGFSSYARFFRACVLCYGEEPGALEREVFEEVVTEPAGAQVELGAVVKRGADGSGSVGEESGEVRITKDEVRAVREDEGAEALGR